MLSSAAAWVEAGAQSRESRDRIDAPIDDAKRIELVGNTHPLARPEYDRGAAPDALPMERMLLLLKRSPEQEAQLEALMDAQADPNSPSYRQWLTPRQFGEFFGPSDGDLAHVAGWLASHGFTVGPIAAGRTTIEFSGNAGQVRDAFHTEIHKFATPGKARLGDSAPEEHWANVRDPEIPAALAPVIAGVVSLHNFRAHPPSRVLGPAVDAKAALKPKAFLDDSSPLDNAYGFFPGTFAIQYNSAPLWNAGINGSGQTIAIAAASQIDPSYVASFWGTWGGSSTAPKVIVNGPAPDPGYGDYVEAYVDTEWAGAVAPGATVALVASASTNSTDGPTLSSQYIVDNNVASILSDSYSLCEAELGAAGNQFYNQLWQQAASQGISVFVGTGNSGPAACDVSGATTLNAAQFGLAVSGIASTPFNVAVGGTNLTLYDPATGANATQPVSETAWNDSCASAGEAVCNSTASEDYYLFAGGGGSSRCAFADPVTNACTGGYPKPSWQAGAGVPADGVRDIPDVSIFSGIGVSGSFYYACLPVSPTGLCYSVIPVGGNGIGAPAMAGFQAMVNQQAGSAQGNVNPILYSLAAQDVLSNCNSSLTEDGTGCVFNDITTGSNSLPCQAGSLNCVVSTSGDTIGILSGYSAGTGYDLATGLGSVNAFNLVNSWPGATVPNMALSATKMAFAKQAKGSTSGAKLVKLTNAGKEPMKGMSISLAGADRADFIESNNCPATLAAHKSCTISLWFKPAVVANLSATVQIKDSNSKTMHTVALTGVGVAASGKK